MESHFWYNKSQRNGIFLLIVYICFRFILPFILLIYLIMIDLDSDRSLHAIQSKIDSLKNTEKNSDKTKTYLFNPNYLTDFKAYQLGLSIDQIDRLFAFRNQGKFVNSSEEFQLDHRS